jgi:hypothetical protein
LKRCLCALAALTVLALSGCGSDSEPGNKAAADGKATPVASAEAIPSGSGPAVPAPNSGLGPVKTAGDIPDPCTLLTNEDVQDLTGRPVTQIDRDGAQAGDTVRYCQWQQTGGQLAIFLARTTPADFKIKIKGAKPVDGVGQDAFTLAGHLYVLYGTVQIDVYSRGGTDEENLIDATSVATVLMPQV